MENPLLYREKNEVAGMGGKKNGMDLSSDWEGKRCRHRKRMKGQVSENEALSFDNANLSRDPLLKISLK